MSALAWSWGWKRWACITLLCFYSITRIGEVLGATRKELLTARDAMEQSGRLYLLIRCPKTRHRGARVQHAEAVGPGWIIDFLSEFFQDLPRTQALYGGSPRVYRRRWDKESDVQPTNGRGHGLFDLDLEGPFQGWQKAARQSRLWKRRKREENARRYLGKWGRAQAVWALLGALHGWLACS
eukprot:s10589_g1.t1